MTWEAPWTGRVPSPRGMAASPDGERGLSRGGEAKGPGRLCGNSGACRHRKWRIRQRLPSMTGGAPVPGALLVISAWSREPGRDRSRRAIRKDELHGTLRRYFSLGRPLYPTGRPLYPTGRPLYPAGRPLYPAGRPPLPSVPEIFCLRPVVDFAACASSSSTTGLPRRETSWSLCGSLARSARCARPGRCSSRRSAT